MAVTKEKVVKALAEVRKERAIVLDTEEGTQVYDSVVDAAEQYRREVMSALYDAAMPPNIIFVQDGRVFEMDVRVDMNLVLDPKRLRKLREEFRDAAFEAATSAEEDGDSAQVEIFEGFQEPRIPGKR